MKRRIVAVIVALIVGLTPACGDDPGGNSDSESGETGGGYN